uniref:Uncharacterized protein n=1 Tax=Siphoviridae sp. ctXZx16 TaxID=2826371 RepID=A0A8S5MKT9_9CAUD|nr:MAG TPA: hypothetical protein [Siphoviridae sp. ctXZx16]DAO32102.1 MAG TPA: hypothetical protein [Caudoviricetes sp.]
MVIIYFCEFLVLKRLIFKGLNDKVYDKWFESKKCEFC